MNVGLVDMEPRNGSTGTSLQPCSITKLRAYCSQRSGWARTRILTYTVKRARMVSGLQDGSRRIFSKRDALSAPLCSRQSEKVGSDSRGEGAESPGSIIVRDLRLWHAGMPNTTNDIRVMLAMIHFAPWYRQRMTMKLPRPLRPILEADDRLRIAAEWQDNPVDHLNAPYGNAFDFSQDG